MPGWLSATLAALPALLSGLEAFRVKRAALMSVDPATSTHAATAAEDDAELARRRAASTTTATKDIN